MSMDDLRHPDCRYCDEYERVTKGLVSERNELKRQLRGEGADDLLDEQESRAIDQATKEAVADPKKESVPAAAVSVGDVQVVVSRADLERLVEIAMRVRCVRLEEGDAVLISRLRSALAENGENE